MWKTGIRAASNGGLTKKSCLGEVMDAIPEAGLASDQAFREYELAIDHAEYVTPPLTDDKVKRVVRIMERHGMTAAVGNAHINGWLGPYDKLSSSFRALGDLFDLKGETAGARVMVIGNSANDQALSGHFPLSVGVANIGKAADKLNSPPSYVTRSARVSPRRSGPSFPPVRRA